MCGELYILDIAYKYRHVWSVTSADWSYDSQQRRENNAGVRTI